MSQASYSSGNLGPQTLNCKKIMSTFNTTDCSYSVDALISHGSRSNSDFIKVVKNGDSTTTKGRGSGGTLKKSSNDKDELMILATTRMFSLVTGNDSTKAHDRRQLEFKRSIKRQINIQ